MIYSATDIETLLQELEASGCGIDKAHLRTILKRDIRSYPLRLASPPLGSPSLLDRVQNKPDAEGTLRQLRKLRLKERRNEVYIPPQAKASLQASDDERFSLMEKVDEFLVSREKVLLLLGDSGAGKSIFNLQLERRLWQDYQKTTGRIPLFINLPAIDKPEQDMIAKQLRRSEFTEPEIREMKERREFILICDGYDESQQMNNLYSSNRLNEDGEWKVQMVISCRSEYLGADYRYRFQPGDRNHPEPELFREAVITPFTSDQVHDYIKQYVLKNQVLWKAREYVQALNVIPGLKDLVKNPFLMTLSLEVLPRMVDPGEHLSATQVTRVALYDQFMEHWLERGKKRLSEKNLSPQAKAALESLVDEGFTRNGVEFLKKLAVAIYKEQDGQPVVRYSRFKDEGSWKAMFFGREDEKQLLREAGPLVRGGNQYRFIHRSLLEYGLALSIFDPQDWKENSMPASMSGRRGSTSSTYSFRVRSSIRAIASAEQGLDINSPIAWRYFIDEPSVLQFLSERVQQEPVFRQQLHDYIEYSKSDEKWRTAAANAITVLVRAGAMFIHADLGGIRIPGADLSYGVFESAQLQDADLRQVNLRGTWLQQADLSNSQMSGVEFGELPYFHENDGIYCCVYSPDGNSLAFSLDNGIIKVYSTSTRELIQTLTGHDGIIRSVTYSPNGDRIASGCRDCTVRVWDTESGSCVQILIGHVGEVNSVAYSPRGDTIASSSDDSTVRVWDVKTGDSRLTLSGHTGWVVSVIYSPNGHQIASGGGGDYTVRLWDVETGECLRILSGHSETVWAVAYSPQGDRIVAGGNDRTVRIWDIGSGICYRVLTGHSGCVNVLTYSVQGDMLVSAGDDKTIRLWDVETGSCRQILKGHTSNVMRVVFSLRGDTITSASTDGTVRLWDVGSGVTRQVATGHYRSIVNITHSRQGEQVDSCSEDGSISRWDVESGACLRVLSTNMSSVWSVTYSPHGDLFACMDYDPAIRLWDVESGDCRHILIGHQNLSSGPVFSTQGNQIASGDFSGIVKIWDVGTGECRHTFTGHTDYVTSMVYSPKGNQLATGSWDYTIRLWDVESGDCLHTLRGHDNYVTIITYSPQGDSLASASADSTVRMWDVESGDCRNILIGYVKIIAYSPSGHHIVSTSTDGPVKTWDAETGECHLTLIGHTSQVKAIVYSPKGDQVITGSTDKTIRLWDTSSGQCRVVVQTFDNIAQSIAWSTEPYYNCFITGYDNGVVRMWQVTDENGACSVRLRWGSMNGELGVGGASIQGVRGLSQLNEQLLKQRGALGEPYVRLREANKKLISMASVVSTLKRTPSKLVQDPAPPACPSVEQSEHKEEENKDSD